MLAINLDAVFHLSQAAARRYVAQGGGKIINIASMLSFQGGILVPGYAASKHAVAGITKSFANELAARGVNVNAIAPGYMATDNTAPIRADEAREKAILDRIPAGRWGTPADLQGTFVFLASSASDYLNGAIIPGRRRLAGPLTTPVATPPPTNWRTTHGTALRNQPGPAPDLRHR